jgi:hypothetical protein
MKQKWKLNKFYNKTMNISLTMIFFKQIFLYLFKELSRTQLLRYFYYGLLLYIIFSSIMSLVGICGSLVECLSVFPLPSGFEDSVFHMNNRGTPDNYGFINPGSYNSPGGPGTPGTPGGGIPPLNHHTNTQIILDDGSWSNGIRNLFIYGGGSYRLVMKVRRGGTPSQTLFILSSTILAEGTSRLILNSLNDPTYLRAPFYNIRAMFQDNDSAAVYLDPNAMAAATGAKSSSTLSGSTVGGGPFSITESILGSGSSSASVPGGTD